MFPEHITPIALKFHVQLEIPCVFLMGSVKHTSDSPCLRLPCGVSHSSPDLQLSCSSLPSAGRGFHMHVWVL